MIIMGLPLYCSVLLLLLRVMTASSSSDSSSNSDSPASPVRCGGVEIPYPFGVIGVAPPAAGIGFNVLCKNRVSPTLLVVGGSGGGGLQIINISLADGFVHVLAGPITEQYCPGGPSTSDTMTPSSSWINLESTPFSFSSSKNNLTVIGCDALALIQPSGSVNYASGCLAFCESGDGGLDESCSGMGCCQAAIPTSLLKGNFSLKLRSIANATGGQEIAFSTGKCSRAFLMQSDALTSSGYTRQTMAFPLVLEWVIGPQRCVEAAVSANYACKDNTMCRDVVGLGYRCQCRLGFYGNPYLGCQGAGSSSPSS